MEGGPGEVKGICMVAIWFWKRGRGGFGRMAGVRLALFCLSCPEGEERNGMGGGEEDGEVERTEERWFGGGVGQLEAR